MREPLAVALLGVLVIVPGARLAGVIGPGDDPSPVAAAISVPSERVVPTASSSPAAELAPTDSVATLTPPTVAPLTPAPSTPPPTAARVTSTSSFVAQLGPGGVDVFVDPTNTRPLLHVTATTEYGTARVLLVVRAADDWLQVLLPVRPNNSVGWIRADAVDLAPSHDEIVVDLEAREMEWRHDSTVVLRTAVAVGAPASPTPPGEYFITDVLAGGGAYGPYILALNGHSDAFTEFGGGDARIALHGTNDPGSIGNASSHGCVRLPNELITDLASRLAPGTPVTIR